MKGELWLEELHKSERKNHGDKTNPGFKLLCRNANSGQLYLWSGTITLCPQGLRCMSKYYQTQVLWVLPQNLSINSHFSYFPQTLIQACVTWDAIPKTPNEVPFTFAVSDLGLIRHSAVQCQAVTVKPFCLSLPLLSTDITALAVGLVSKLRLTPVPFLIHHFAKFHLPKAVVVWAVKVNCHWIVVFHAWWLIKV